MIIIICFRISRSLLSVVTDPPSKYKNDIINKYNIKIININLIIYNKKIININLIIYNIKIIIINLIINI